MILLLICNGIYVSLSLFFLFFLLLKNPTVLSLAMSYKSLATCGVAGSRDI